MAYYNRFRGTFDHEMAKVYERRQSVIDSARQLQPDNVDELIKASGDEREFRHVLEWVEVPNPWQQAEGDTIAVRPILGIAEGHEDTEREKDRLDKGVWKLGLETRLPSGDIWYIGDMMFFHREGELKSEPTLSVNISPTPETTMPNQNIGWESADAELLLSLAETALQGQKVK